MDAINSNNEYTKISSFKYSTTFSEPGIFVTSGDYNIAYKWGRVIDFRFNFKLTSDTVSTGLSCNAAVNLPNDYLPYDAVSMVATDGTASKYSLVNLRTGGDLNIYILPGSPYSIGQFIYISKI